MIKLASKLKKNDKAGEDGNNQGGGRRGNSAPVKSFLIRDRLLLKESQEMHDNLPSSCKVHYFNPNELHRFELTIVPEESYWKGGRFRFVVEVPEEYNFSPPKVKCQTRIWHPNITEDGDICLSLLRESAIDGMGWAPTRTLKDVIWGLNSLFTDLLDFEDSLNHEAAEHYHQNPTEFQHKVRDYLYRYAKN